MHSDLLERAQIARESIVIPAFPRAEIRSAVTGARKPVPGRRAIISTLLAAFSVVAIAAAAEILQQAHISFTPQGEMVISLSGHSSIKMNPTDGDLRAAAAHVDFPATLPSALPAGTTPKWLGIDGPDAMDIRYDLPGSERKSHHLLYIFLANPKNMADLKAPSVSVSSTYSVRLGDHVESFRAGGEQVIVVSNGLTAAELAAIKQAMLREAKDRR